MALTVRPTDGLIQRLLQQNSPSLPKPQETTPAERKIVDQVNISRHAHHPMDAESVSKTESRSQTQSKLESQLLRLYIHDYPSEAGR